MIKDWLEIDGMVFDVAVTSIKESGTVLYSENTGRTIAVGAPMTLDPLGTFYNYTVIVKKRNDDLDAYDRLYTYVTKPRYRGMTIKAVHNQSTITFNGYVSTAEREIERIDTKNKKVYWREMVIQITSMKAQVLPT